MKLVFPSRPGFQTSNEGQGPSHMGQGTPEPPGLHVLTRLGHLRPGFLWLRVHTSSRTRPHCPELVSDGHILNSSCRHCTCDLQARSAWRPAGRSGWSSWAPSFTPAEAARCVCCYSHFAEWGPEVPKVTVSFGFEPSCV